MMTVRHPNMKFSAPRGVVLVIGALCVLLRYAKIDMSAGQWQDYYTQNVNSTLAFFLNAAHFLAPVLLVFFALFKNFRADMIMLGICAALSAVSLIEEILIYQADSYALFISIEASAICLAASVISIIALIFGRRKKTDKANIKEGIENNFSEK